MNYKKSEAPAKPEDEEFLCIIDSMDGEEQAFYCVSDETEILENADMIQEIMINMMAERDHRTGYWDWYIMKNGNVVGFCEKDHGWIWEEEYE